MTDTKSDVALMSDNSKLSLGGVTSAVANNGMIKFNDFTMSATPGTNETLWVSSSILGNIVDTSSNTNVNVSLEFRL